MTGIVILAAGGSTRLGQPKQQLLYKEKTLLQNSIDAAVNSVCKPIIVVLGADVNNAASVAISRHVHSIINESWQQGIGSSIKCGIEELIRNQPAITDAIIMLCDQPFVNAQLLNNLVIKRTESGKKIIACYYNNTIGVPVLFHKEFFPQLLALNANEGAKSILLNNESLVETIPFPLGKVDIDTAEDYERLTKN